MVKVMLNKPVQYVVKLLCVNLVDLLDVSIKLLVGFFFGCDTKFITRQVLQKAKSIMACIDQFQGESSRFC